MVVNPVGIEGYSLSAHRRHHKQLTARGQNPLQFAGSLQVTAWVQRIAIAPEPDMFKDMHA